MHGEGLNYFIEKLDERGELIRIKSFTDPVLEITEVTDRISKQKGGGQALLFEDTGTQFPVLINALGSEKRMALAFRSESVQAVETEIDSLFRKMTNQPATFFDKLKMLSQLREFSSWMPRKTNQKGKCQEVVITNPDLGIFPILKCWPADGGRFITLPCVHTVDPETGAPNVGMYRMQVFGADLTGMHWHRHKTGANHFLKYKKAGKRMPVSVSLGGDPVYTYAATAPMPENMDEYMLAGFLRKKGVKLVKCLTNDLYVPGDADIVIEGYVDPAEEFILEGPFGDHTGFYSLADYYPKFHVTCITHRKNAVYPATIVGIPPMEDAYIGKATERIFLSPIRMAMLPEMMDMDLPFAGVAHNIVIVQIIKSYPGQAQKVMNSLWGAGQMMFNKIMVVVDEDFAIHDYAELIRKGISRFMPAQSIHFSKGPLDILDHSSTHFAFGSKLGIDLTKPLEGEIIPFEKTEKHRETANRGLPWVAETQDLSDKHGIPVVILSINKKEDYQLKDLLARLETEDHFQGNKLILLVDQGVNLSDFFTIAWLVGSNIDPARDITLLETGNSGSLVVDATMKVHSNDGFSRDWPNVVVSDIETIEFVDKKWNEIGLGDFIPSPSLKFLPFLTNKGAVHN